MVFLFSLFFFFFGCGLIGSVSTEVGGFEWARLWVGDVSVGVMSVWFNDDDDGNEDGGFGVWVDLDYEGFGFGSGCGGGGFVGICG